MEERGSGGEEDLHENVHNTYLSLVVESGVATTRNETYTSQIFSNISKLTEKATSHYLKKPVMYQHELQSL